MKNNNLEFKDNNNKMDMIKTRREYLTHPMLYFYYPDYNTYKRISYSYSKGIMDLSTTQEGNLVNEFANKVSDNKETTKIHRGSFYRVK